MHIRQELLIAAQCSALHKGRYFSWKETLPPLARPRPSSCGKLPLELLGLIFSHLSDDKPALSACSLVNRAWFYASRAHLFRTLEVSWISLANMVRWKRAYMPAGDESWDRYSRRCRAQLGRAPLACALLCFLEEAGELIGASIRELRLVGWQHDTCLLSVDDVDALIRRLPLLTKLSLTRATLRWSGQGLPAGRHPLRTLEVHDCLVSGSSAFALLTLFPAVETLLWDASDDLDEDDVDGALLADLLGPFEMPRLAAFDAGRSLYPHHAPEATALLVQGMCMRGEPAVASLELDILMDSFDADSLLTLFEDVGPNLLSLRMELGCIFPTRGTRHLRYSFPCHRPHLRFGSVHPGRARPRQLHRPARARARPAVVLDARRTPARPGAAGRPVGRPGQERRPESGPALRCHLHQV